MVNLVKMVKLVTIISALNSVLVRGKLVKMVKQIRALARSVLVKISALHGAHVRLPRPPRITMCVLVEKAVSGELAIRSSK